MTTPLLLPSPTLAPGARVEIRGAEWIVRRVDVTSSGGHSVLVAGVSELVRGREARFLTEIEGKRLQLLDPSDTQLVPDDSPQYRNTRLYLEALLRQSPPTGPQLHVGHRAAIDDLPYQLDPALQALDQPRHRILMADAVGLGKTIEVGVLLSELIARGKARRILVVAVKGMLTQIQKELWSRFTVPLKRLDSEAIQRIRTEIPTNANPFHHWDRAIISVDTLKQDTEYRVYLENAYWDVIVIDEAQNVAERGAGASQRAKLARLLAGRSDTLILTSATPHDGRPRSFASLMNMLNPTAIANPDTYGPDDIKGLFLRRFKRDVREQVAASMHERLTLRLGSDASAAEEAAFDILADLSFRSFDRQRRSGKHLFKTTLEKALFSSPGACRATIAERLRKLHGDGGADAAHDREALQTLDAALAAIGPGEFGKYQRFLACLRSRAEIAWDGSDARDRLVIFTERVETLRFLREHLPRDLGLSTERVAVLYGQEGSDVEQNEIVEAFGRERTPVRLLIATDIASEGLNLHYLSHKMVHFDIPWSLMVFQQRNGRIDRYGQERHPLIAYLVTRSRNDKIRGDARILELLVEKDRQANENIGDPLAFFGVYDEREEELITGKAIEDGLSAEQFDSQIEQRAKVDFLQILMNAEPVPTGRETAGRTRPRASLFGDDMAFARTALEGLRAESGIRWDLDGAGQRLLVHVAEDTEAATDLRRRFRELPREALPEDRPLQLTIDREAVKRAIRDSRGEERAWPDVQLLWDLHPFVDWLTTKLLVAFGRREAPVLVLPRLQPGEALFLCQGEIPDRQGHPVVHGWFAVRFQRLAYGGILGLDEVLARTALALGPSANPGTTPDLLPYQGVLPEVVQRAREWMSARRAEFEANVAPRLAEQMQRLRVLQERQSAQLELELPETQSLNRLQRQKKDERRRQIERNFAEWQAWVRNTLTTEDQPFLRVAALFLAAERG